MPLPHIGTLSSRSLCALALLLCATLPAAGLESRSQLTDIEQDGVLELLTLHWDQTDLVVETAAGDPLLHLEWSPGDSEPLFMDLNRDGYPDLTAGDQLLYDGRGLAADILASRYPPGHLGLPHTPSRIEDPFVEAWNSGESISNIWDLAMDDPDGDGNWSLVTQTYHYPGGSVLVYRSDQDNSYTQVWESTVENSSAITTLCTGDIDGDGLMEIMAGEASNQGICHLWESDGGDLFEKLPLDCILGWQAREILVSDLDGDDIPEYCLASGEGGSGSSVKVLEHAGTPGENSFNSLLTYATGDYITGISVGDSDNDGRGEIVMQMGGVLGTSMLIRRLEYEPSGGYFQLKEFNLGYMAPVLSTLIADLDGDGANELLIGSAGFIMMLTADHDDSYVVSWTNSFPVIGHVLDLTLGPLNSEGFPLVGFSTNAGHVDLFGYDGQHFELQNPEPVFTGQLTRNIAVGYFDGVDGMLDMILTRAFLDQLVLFERQTLTAAEWSPISPEGQLAITPVTTPCRGGAELLYSLPAAGVARLEVFDVRGRRVRLIGSEPTEPGRHLVRWDGCDDRGRQVAGGVYFARLTGNERVASTRLVLLR